MEAKKAAAEARRQKILNRGRDRLSQITGSVPAAPAAPKEEQPLSTTPGDEHAGPTATHPGPSAPLVLQQQCDARGDTPGGAAPTEALLQQFTAAIKESASTPDLSDASAVRQRKAGIAATGARWASYQGPAPPVAKPRRAPAPLLPATPAESLAAAVSTTAPLRMLMAVALAVLTAAAALGSAAAAPGSEAPLWALLAAAWGQQLQRLPPLANLAMLDASIIAAAFLLLRSKPGWLSGKVDGPTPGLLMKAAALVPGLADGIALLAAWQRAVVGVMDDVAVFVVTLVLWNLAPQVLAHTMVAT